MSSASSASASARVAHLKAQSIDLESRISGASNRDEALRLAFEAAELCFKALKLAIGKDEKSDIRSRCQTLVGEAERIKSSDDWQPFASSPPLIGLDSPALVPSRTSSPPAGSSTSRSQRFGNSDMTRDVISPVPSSVEVLSNLDCLTITGLDLHATPFVPSTTVKRLIEPVSKREITRSEHILLLQGSKLNGFKFPPWKEPPNAQEFELGVGEAPFIDKPELCLSAHQLASFDGWHRANDAIPPPSWFPGERTSLGPIMQATRTIDLVQDAATDCSVVASLCAGAARAEKGHVKIYSEIMYPWDAINMAPQISPNGKYVLRLNFNGCYRKVVIDDRLPVSSTKRSLHIIDRKNPALLWPALLEKAYLKVRGGYDFPGSNSSTDLWILTGWIPEQVFLEDDTTEPENVWKRMLNAFQYGDVLVTMGTGKMSNRLERELGLAGQHDYAVLDLKEEDDQKLVLLKNPWCEGTSWKGTLPQSITPTTVNKLGAGYALSEISETTPRLLNAAHVGRTEQELSSGIFWIDWNNILQHFESIYLNWNPGLFTYRQDIHFPWDLTQKRSAAGSFVENPQFAVSCVEGGSLWLLLCRHFKDAATSEDDDDPSEVNVGPTGEFVGHISLYVYDRNGQRIHISASPVERGPYVDSPQTLLRLEIPSHTTYTVVVSEQKLPAINHTFSLIAFSSVPIELTYANDRYHFTSSLESAWTSTTAGGGAHVVTYSSNPQFSLQVPNKTPIALLLETPNSELSVHVRLVHGGGKRILNLSQRDIVIDSGEYRRGSAFAELQDLDAGTYTVICSTFEAGQKAGFTLRVDTFVQTQLRQLPGENAGRLSQSIPNVCFSWGNNKIAAPLFPKRLFKLSAIAKYRGSNTISSTSSNPPYHTQSPVRISVELGRGPERRFLAVSSDGEFLAANGAGVRTPELDLWPEMRRNGDMWLVLERMGSPAMPGEERFGVEVWCDGKVEELVQVGYWRAWDD
ncbi:cysteine proteinase [Tothia fuscella]|uniref:Cysteine proteinase n=1 Tax=Tothia fuscella TaxID=1048955 RepID=A0A9P4NQ43_9PEZI|nr:cysteine proteinase [Tothia fuscella]